MLYLIGFFLLIISILKLVDWKGFVEAFRDYDLIGRKSLAYSAVYPALEAILGVWFIIGLQTSVAAIVTLVLMLLGAISATIMLRANGASHKTRLRSIPFMPVVRWMLLQNLILIVLALIILV